ncbi:MAG TPA: response regulator [Anaeromyxobacter sp.]
MTPPRILIVDDDETHLACARELLEAEGYRVEVHLTGFGATERMIRTRFDLVLVDMNMPALSGEGLVSILRKRVHAPGVRMFLYSSNDEDALRRAASRLQIDGYVCKGDPEELRRKVGRALGMPRAGGAGR